MTATPVQSSHVAPPKRKRPSTRIKTPSRLAMKPATAPVGGPLTLQDPSLYDGSRAKPYKLPNTPEPA